MPSEPDLDDPTSRVRNLRVAGSEALRRGDVTDARALFEEALATKPGHAAGLAGLARCAQRDSEWDTAADLWGAARAAAPGARHPNWHRRHITTLLLAGRGDEARREIEAFWGATDLRRAYRAATRNVADGTHERLRFDHVLIVTYGRSGSTLLQGMLNTINGLLIRGENGNVFHDFFRAARGLEENRHRSGSSFAPYSAWFGMAEMSTLRLADELRPTARRMLLGNDLDDPAVRAIGFKEIRYLDVQDDLVDYLAFLEDLFPNTAFVFNTRDPAETVASGWWVDEDPAVVSARIHDLHDRFTAFAAARSNCFSIDYHDVVGTTSRLQELFAFLGAEFDQARADAVLAVSHSYGPDDPDDSEPAS
ncbi:MAG: sulfotransferase [Acidimicrobiales bacterium]|nr:sulfotransferase [Acidimicrobiales bacterium]